MKNKIELLAFFNRMKNRYSPIVIQIFVVLGNNCYWYVSELGIVNKVVKEIMGEDALKGIGE